MSNEPINKTVFFFLPFWITTNCIFRCNESVFFFVFADHIHTHTHTQTHHWRTERKIIFNRFETISNQLDQAHELSHHHIIACGLFLFCFVVEILNLFSWWTSKPHETQLDFGCYFSKINVQCCCVPYITCFCVFCFFGYWFSHLRYKHT